MSGGAWARELGDTYAEIAHTSKSAAMSEANAAEASKYYGIADRMDKALPDRDLCPSCDFDPMAPHNGKGQCPPRPSAEAA